MDQRTWKITFGIVDEWVTEEDKEFYIKAIAAGQKMVVLLDGRVFTDRFTKISSKAHDEANKKLAAGMWECPAKNWHNGKDCYCEQNYLIEGDTAKLT